MVKPSELSQKSHSGYNWVMTIRHSIIFLLFMLLAVFTTVASAEKLKPPTSHMCPPTPEDEMGPFYRPGAPLSSRIGTGYVLTGSVKSAVDCAPIPSPLIELWQTGPNGRYDDAHRAAIITDESGQYRFETDYPGAYFSRPAHIHIRVTAKGFRPLTTQHYLQKNTTEAVFNLVLVPEKIK